MLFVHRNARGGRPVAVPFSGALEAQRSAVGTGLLNLGHPLGNVRKLWSEVQVLRCG